MMAAEQMFVTLFVDGSCYGIEVGLVRETLDHMPITPAPLAPPAVRGIINLRGEIVTVVDLACQLGRCEERSEDRGNMHVIAEIGDQAISFLVDDVGDVLEVAEDQFAPPPATLSDSARDLITGAYKLDDHLLLVLDAARAAEV
jgi:purine-binding chemotaxis protein CheW